MFYNNLNTSYTPAFHYIDVSVGIYIYIYIKSTLGSDWLTLTIVTRSEICGEWPKNIDSR